MLHKALSAVITEMNDYFRNKLKTNEDSVILSAIANPDGSIAIQGENKIIATLVNIQKDAVLKTLGYNTENKSRNDPQTAMNIVLHVLFSANFNDYSEALISVSSVLSFFHQKSTFNGRNSPGLPSNIEKLIFEEDNLNTEQLNNVWSTIGAKYMPSVMYKVRLLTSESNT